MALLSIFCGFGAALVGFTGIFLPFIRNAETILPDHDMLEKAVDPAG